MYLRSFSYQQQLAGNMLDVLFKDLEKYHGEFDYSLELIEAAFDGRVDISKPFNLFGWCKTVKEGKFQEDLRRLKKEEYLLDDDEDDKTGVKSSSLIEKRDDYEVFEDNEEILYTVRKVTAIQQEIVSEVGVDIIFCMRKALQGSTKAIKELQSVCERYDYIQEYVQIILASGIEFDVLFPERIEVFHKTSNMAVEQCS